MSATIDYTADVERLWFTWSGSERRSGRRSRYRHGIGADVDGRGDQFCRCDYFFDMLSTIATLSRIVTNVERSMNFHFRCALFLTLTVVTNMIDVMMMLMNDDHNSTIFIGGEFSEKHSGFVGEISNDSIRKYRFEAAFLGASGVDIECGAVYTDTSADALTKSVVLECSRKKYLLLETCKFGRASECV